MRLLLHWWSMFIMFISFNLVRLMVKLFVTREHHVKGCQRYKYTSFLPALLPFTRLHEASNYDRNGDAAGVMHLSTLCWTCHTVILNAQISCSLACYLDWVWSHLICDCFFDLSCLVDLSCIGRSNRKAYSRWLWWEQLIKTVVPLAWDWKHLLPKHRVTICIHMWPLSLTYPVKSVGRSRIVTSLIPKSRFFSLLLCCSCVVSVTIRSHATKASPLQELQIGSNKSL